MPHQSNERPVRFPAPRSDPLTERALLAAQGDRVALSDVVRGTQADVWRLCAHLVDPQAADDLTQETYARAIGALPRYRGESPVRLWLVGIARHVCIDTVRRRARRRRVLLEPPPTSHPDATGTVDLDDLLTGLDDDQRAAFVLTQVLGLRYAEAAEVLAVPVGTIRSRVARARQALVGLLAADDEATGG